MDEKIVPFEKVSSRIEALRAANPGGVVVLCHGCFDIVHPGHIRHLRFAKEQGAVLVVSITPDICIQKGSNRPLMPQELRSENLAALEFVDVVTIAPGETGIEPIESVKPDVYVKGSEYAVSRDPRFLKEKDLVESQGGTVVYSSGEVVFSSSEIIREHDMDLALNEKLNYICKRHRIDRALMLGSLSKASGLTALMIGEAILDEHMQCEGLGMSQEAPVLSLTLKHKSLSVGGPGAIALHLAAAGVKMQFLTSARPEGPIYESFKLAMEEGGVELINVDDRSRQVCVKSHVMVDRSKVLELESASYRPLDSAMRSAMLRKFKKSLKGDPSCVILSDYGYGLLSDDLVLSMVSSAKEIGIECLSDISMTPRTNLEKFDQTDVFAATESELRACMHDYEGGLSVIVDRFYSLYEVKYLFLMLPDGGAIFFRRANSSNGAGGRNMESVHVPQLSMRREGRTGLPEAFMAGLILGRATRLAPEQCVYMSALFIAAHASGSVSSKSVDPDRIRRIIDERKELV